MRDMVIFDFLQQVLDTSYAASQDPNVADLDWVLRDSMVTIGVMGKQKHVSALWASQEADRLRKQADYMEGHDADLARRLARMLDSRARPGLSGFSVKGYKQIPDSPKYGALRGAWVKKEIFESLVGSFKAMSEESPFIEKWLGVGSVGTTATQIWKAGKVAWNFVAVIRNIVGGAIAADAYGDVNKLMVIPRITQALQGLMGKGSLESRRGAAVAGRMGAAGTGYAAQELGLMENSLLRRAKTEVSWLKRLGYGIKDVWAWAPKKYGQVELVLKTAVIIDQLAKGKSEQEAMRVANHAIFDYSNVPPWVRYLRATPFIAPFVTFPYKNFPRLVSTAIKRPWKLIPYYFAGAALDALIRSWFDVDDDDIEKLRANMPLWMQGEADMMILPYQDENGKWQAVDLGFYFPWGGINDAVKAAYQGRPEEIPANFGFGGGPYADLVAMIKTNRDPRTDRKIFDPALPPSDQMANAVMWMWRMMAPSWVTDQGAARHLYDALTKQVDPRTGEMKDTTPQAIARFFGANLYEFDPDDAYNRNMSRLYGQILDVEAEIQKISLDQSLSEEQRDKDMDKYIARAEKFIQEMNEYSERALGLTPKLQRGPQRGGR